MTQFSVRKLEAAETAPYNAYFADGARLHPRTLRIAPEDVTAAPFVVVGPDRVTLVALDSAGAWLGVGSLERELGRIKRRHVAWLVRMLVTDSGRGVGRRLVRELIEEARRLPGVAKLNLTVAADNAAAVHLYSSEGFVEYSREPDAFRVEGDSVTELSMSLSL